MTRSVIRRWSVCVSWIQVASATARRFREPIHNSQTTDPRGYAVAIGKRCPPALAHLAFVPVCVTQCSTGSRRNVRGRRAVLQGRDRETRECRTRAGSSAALSICPRSGRSQGESSYRNPFVYEVVGNTAYISMITVQTYDDNVSRVGDKGVYWVQDGEVAPPLAILTGGQELHVRLLGTAHQCPLHHRCDQRVRFRPGRAQLRREDSA